MYFIVINGTQSGPFSKEELRMRNISPSTFVWREGLNDWVPASSLPELADILVEESAFGAYAQQQPEPPQKAPDSPAYPPYGTHLEPGAYDPYRRQPEFPENYTNWQPWAIVGTICGALFSCIGLIFGVLGIVNASKANKYYAAGLRSLGDAANSTARTMTIISLCLAALGLGICIFKGQELLERLSYLY